MTGLSPQHILSLTNSLTLFQSCTIHIISNQIQPKSAQNYLLATPVFPIIYSLHQYYVNKTNGHYRCNKNVNDENFYNVNKTQAEFKFKSRPHPRRTCGINVIIDPLQCLKWEHAASTDPSSKSLHKVLPESFWDPIYDVEMDWGISLYKSNWIWIHVEKQSKNSSSLVLHSTDLFFVLEHKSQLSGLLPKIPPTKLLFRLHRSTVSSIYMYTVKHAYLATYREALRPVFTQIERICKIRDYTFIKGNPNFQPCVSKVIWQFSYMVLKPVNIGEHSSIMSMLVSIDEPTTDLVASVIEQQTSSVAKGWMSETTNEIMAHSFLTELLVNSTIIYGSTLYFVLRVFPVVRVKIQPFARAQLFHEEPFPLHFLSCTSLKKSDGRSVKDFVSAFHWKTWLSLVSIAVTCGLVLNLLKGSNLKKNVYEDLTFAYNLLICQSCSAINKWKWCFSPWLFAAIIFSYSYQGENITRLCRALKNSPIDSFDEVLSHNFSIYSPGVLSLVEKLKSMPRPVLEEMAMKAKAKPDSKTRRAGNQVYVSRNSDITMTKLDMYLRFHTNSMINKTGPGSSKLFRLVSAVERLLVKPDNVFDFINQSSPEHILQQVKICKAHALVDSYDNIAEMYTHLLKQDGIASENLHISTHPIESTFREWEFVKLHVSANHFNVRLGSLVHSGLVQLWVTQTKNNLPLNVRNALQEKQTKQSLWRNPKPLSLKGNIAVVFYMLPSFVVIPLIVFLLELTGNIKNAVLTTCKFLWSFVVKLWNMGYNLASRSGHLHTKTKVLPFA